MSACGSAVCFHWRRFLHIGYHVGTSICYFLTQSQAISQSFRVFTLVSDHRMLVYVTFFNIFQNSWVCLYKITVTFTMCVCKRSPVCLTSMQCVFVCSQLVFVHLWMCPCKNADCICVCDRSASSMSKWRPKAWTLTPEMIPFGTKVPIDAEHVDSIYSLVQCHVDTTPIVLPIASQLQARLDLSRDVYFFGHACASARSSRQAGISASNVLS